MSWLFPSKRSDRLCLPRGPSNTYALSTLTQGSWRRSALNRSRSRVNSFSLARCSRRAASHSCRDTTLWALLLMIPSSALLRRRGLAEARPLLHRVQRRAHLGEGLEQRSSLGHFFDVGEDRREQEIRQ